MLRLPITRSARLFAAMIALSGPSIPISAQEQQRPNVILMLADDLANEDLSCYGSERIGTPRIDQLAAEGVRLSNYYSGSTVCTPARMALLSGSYPARLGWRWGVLGYGLPPDTGMSPKVHTLAEAFRDAGYRTAMAGKWHLGSRNMGPNHQGFDSAYYIYMSNNQSRDMYRDGELVRKDWDNRLLTETFTEEVIRVINEPNDRPFFLYVPWTAPHFPADPHPEWHGKSGEDASGKFTDVVRELDHRIGEILDALEKAGKAADTIVIFTSDNGRQPGQQGPNERLLFRGHKWQTPEGGMRVPMIIRYPGKLPTAGVIDAMMTAMDIYPTLAEACGFVPELPEDAQAIDGVSTWQNLTRPESQPARHELLYWHGKGQATAIRDGDWKLHFNRGDQPPEDDALEGPALYHLKNDPMEANDMASKHPEMVRTLLTRAKEKLLEIYEKPMPPGTWPGVELESEPIHPESIWGPWMPTREDAD